MSVNPHEQAARATKAAALYATLAAAGYSADAAAAFGEDARRVVATLANVRPPSDETWDVAVGLLRRHGDVATAAKQALARYAALTDEWRAVILRLRAERQRAVDEARADDLLREVEELAALDVLPERCVPHAALVDLCGACRQSDLADEQANRGDEDRKGAAS